MEIDHGNKGGDIAVSRLRTVEQQPPSLEIQICR